jgi:hypothetical protein
MIKQALRDGIGEARIEDPVLQRKGASSGEAQRAPDQSAKKTAPIHRPNGSHGLLTVLRKRQPIRDFARELKGKTT